MAAYSFLAIGTLSSFPSFNFFCGPFVNLFGHFSIWSKFTYTLIKERKQEKEETKITTKGGKMEKKTAHEYIVHLNITRFVRP